MPSKKRKTVYPDGLDDIKTESQALNYRIHNLAADIRDLEEDDNTPYFVDEEGGEGLCTFKLKSICPNRINELLRICSTSVIMMRHLKSYSVDLSDESPVSSEFVFRSHRNTQAAVEAMKKAVELFANLAMMFDDEVRCLF